MKPQLIWLTEEWGKKQDTHFDFVWPDGHILTINVGDNQVTVLSTCELKAEQGSYINEVEVKIIKEK